jgi:hypothetical protein
VKEEEEEVDAPVSAAAAAAAVEAGHRVMKEGSSNTSVHGGKRQRRGKHDSHDNDNGDNKPSSSSSSFSSSSSSSLSSLNLSCEWYCTPCSSGLPVLSQGLLGRHVIVRCSSGGGSGSGSAVGYAGGGQAACEGGGSGGIGGGRSGGIGGGSGGGENGGDKSGAGQQQQQQQQQHCYQFRRGVVDAFECLSGKHRVTYQDNNGEVEWKFLALADHHHDVFYAPETLACALGVAAPPASPAAFNNPSPAKKKKGSLSRKPPKSETAVRARKSQKTITRARPDPTEIAEERAEY